MHVIFREDYEAWASCIRSEQIPASELVRLMRDNPRFAEWYRVRRIVRQIIEGATMIIAPSERVCTLCRHHTAAVHNVEGPQGMRSVTVHQCDALKGSHSPVDGVVMLMIDCGSMRLSEICGREGKLFEAVGSKQN